MLYTSKESSENAKCRFRLKKCDLLLKKWKNSILKKKKSKGPFEVGTAGKKISVFQNFNFFFEKWLQWEVATVENQTGMKFELISSIH